MEPHFEALSTTAFFYGDLHDRIIPLRLTLRLIDTSAIASRSNLTFTTAFFSPPLRSVFTFTMDLPADTHICDCLTSTFLLTVPITIGPFSMTALRSGCAFEMTLRFGCTLTMAFTIGLFLHGFNSCSRVLLQLTPRFCPAFSLDLTAEGFSRWSLRLSFP